MRRKQDLSIGQFEEPKIPLFLVFASAMCGLNVAAVAIMLMSAG